MYLPYLFIYVLGSVHIYPSKGKVYQVVYEMNFIDQNRNGQKVPEIPESIDFAKFCSECNVWVVLSFRESETWQINNVLSLEFIIRAGLMSEQKSCIEAI